jgi:hypothetical protein
MLIILFDIFIHVRIRQRAVIQAGQTNNHQANVQKQMFILMFASICVFLITTLPLGIYKIISTRGQIIGVQALLTSIWAGLGWFQSLNYAVDISIRLINL